MSIQFLSNFPSTPPNVRGAPSCLPFPALRNETYAWKWINAGRCFVNNLHWLHSSCHCELLWALLCWISHRMFIFSCCVYFGVIATQPSDQQVLRHGETIDISPQRKHLQLGREGISESVENSQVCSERNFAVGENSSRFSVRRHKSKFHRQVRKEVVESKDDHKTMGYADVPLEPPENFLKIGAGIRPSPPKNDHDCVRKTMPPIPKQDLPSKEKNVKNFRLENIKSAVKSKPRRPSARYVDTRNGDYHDLQKSGLQPAYIHSTKFGKLPKYLVRRMKHAAMEEDLVRADEIRRQPVYRFITQDERAEMLRVIFLLRLTACRSISAASILIWNPSLIAGLEAKLARVAENLSRITGAHWHRTENHAQNQIRKRIEAIGKGYSAGRVQLLHLRLRRVEWLLQSHNQRSTSKINAFFSNCSLICPFLCVTSSKVAVNHTQKHFISRASVATPKGTSVA